jgi:hypothetical protein
MFGDKIEAGRDVIKATGGSKVEMRINADDLMLDRIRKRDLNLEALEKTCGPVFKGGLQFRLSRQFYAEQIADAFHCDLASAKRTTERLVQGDPIAPQAVRDAWATKFYHTLMSISGQTCSCENCRRARR